MKYIKCPYLTLSFKYTFFVPVSIPKSDLRNVPRVGELMLLLFKKQKYKRLFYVNNVKCLPSPPS